MVVVVSFCSFLSWCGYMVGSERLELPWCNLIQLYFFRIWFVTLVLCLCVCVLFWVVSGLRECVE